MLDWIWVQVVVSVLFGDNQKDDDEHKDADDYCSDDQHKHLLCLRTLNTKEIRQALTKIVSRSSFH